MRRNNRGAKAREKEALRALINQAPPPAELLNLAFDLPTADVSPNAHDRYVAILGGAVVESGLRRAITKYLNPNRTDAEIAAVFEEPDGALFFSFADKINAAFAFGIVDNEQRIDLRRIKDIRNIFAHTLLDKSFENDDVKSLCFYRHTVFTDEYRSLWSGERQIYAALCSVYYSELILHVPTFPDWPEAWRKRFLPPSHQVQADQ